MVEEARSFAEKAHEGQFRKGTKRPYIVHPLEVAKIVSTMTDDEEQSPLHGEHRIHCSRR